MSTKIFIKDIEAVGRVLRTIRESKQLTQSKVATLAGIDKKHLRDIEKGRYSAGLDLIFLICKALKVNRILLFCLALEADFEEFIRNADKMLTNGEALTNDEVTAYANNGKSLRAVTEKEENISTKCLYGGDKCGIIKIIYKDTSYLYYTKVVMNKCVKKCS